MARELYAYKFDSVITELKKKFRVAVDWKRTFQDLIILRSDLTSEKEVSDFLKTYSDITRSSWTVCSNVSHPNRILLHKYWMCQHSKKRKDGNSKRNTDCPSSIDIVIKKVNRFTKRNDPFLKTVPPLCAVIRIMYPDHNHNVDSTSFLQMLRVSSETRKQFFAYFDDGLMPMEAKHAHESRIMLHDHPAELLKNCSINPSLRQVYYLRKIWCAQQYKEYIDSGHIAPGMVKRRRTGRFSKLRKLLKNKTSDVPHSQIHPLLKKKTSNSFDCALLFDEDSQSSVKLEQVQPKNNSTSRNSQNEDCVSNATTSPVVIYLSACINKHESCDGVSSDSMSSTNDDCSQKIVQGKRRAKVSSTHRRVLLEKSLVAVKERKCFPDDFFESFRKSSHVSSVSPRRKLADKNKASGTTVEEKTTTRISSESPVRKRSRRGTPHAAPKKRMLLPKPEPGVLPSSTSSTPKGADCLQKPIETSAISVTTTSALETMLTGATVSLSGQVPQFVLPSFVNSPTGQLILPVQTVLPCVKNNVSSVNLTLPTFQCVPGVTTTSCISTVEPGSPVKKSLGQTLTSVPIPLQMTSSPVNYSVNVNIDATSSPCSAPVNMPTVIYLPNSESKDQLDKSSAAKSSLPSNLNLSTVNKEKFLEGKSNQS